MHTFSILFTAQSAAGKLGTPENRAEAARWRREHGIGKVYVESFRGLLVERDLPVTGRGIVLTLSKDKEVALERGGGAYRLTVPPRTLVALY